MQRPRLGQLLIESGWVDAAGLERGLEEQKRRGGKLGTVLVQLGLVPERAVTELLAQQLHLPLAQLDASTLIPAPVLARLPASLIRSLEILPLEVLEGGKALAVAVSEPVGPAWLAELQTLAHGWIVPRLAGPSVLAAAIEKNLGPPPERAASARAAAPSRAPARSESPPSASGDHRELRAMLELLVEKGLITQEEYLRKLAQPPHPFTHLPGGGP